MDIRVIGENGVSIAVVRDSNVIISDEQSDFSSYGSKSLRDFIYESNNGRDMFFVQTEDEALNKLKTV